MNASKIIGVVFLALAVLSFFLKRYSGAVILAVAGLVLLFLPKKLSKESFNDFMSIDWSKFGKCGVVEALFWLLLFGVLKVSSILLEGAAKKVDSLVDLKNLGDVSVLQQNTVAAREFLFVAVGVVIASVILWFIIYSISRFFIWKFITEKKQRFTKFLLYNLVWWLIWSPIFVILLLGLRPSAVPILAVVAGFLYLYLTIFVHYAFFRFTLGKALSKAFSGAVSKAYLFVIPLIYIFAVFIVLFQLFRFPMAGWVASLLSFFLIVIFLCWVRLYFSHIIRKHNVV